MSKLVFICSLMCVVLFTSCNREDVQTEINDPISKNDLSGEKLFRAVMFGIGDFSNSIVLLKDVNESYNKASIEQQQEIDNKLDILEKSIREQNPYFFDEFKELVISKKHNDVKKAIEIGAVKIADNMNLLVPNFNELKEEVEKDIENRKYITKENQINAKLYAEREKDYQRILSNNFISSPISQEMGIVWGIYFVAAVHNTVAVTANVAVVMVAWVKFAVDQMIQPMEDATLKMDMLINDITLAK